MSEAAASAEVTHAHPEGVAGAVAVAIAAALSATEPQLCGAEFLERVADRMSEGAVRDKLRQAAGIDDSGTAAGELGVGHDTSAVDTVPFGLWVVAHHGHDFADACWTAVAAGGDIDTTCAIIGGILGARATSDGLPLDWLERCEPLPEWAITHRVAVVQEVEWWCAREDSNLRPPAS
ncbi:ADP-ribosylglycohydrolase family protein [Nocardia sp. 2]|uniref:ADP-ribosylglycohydrolase family protein n=1 Tax=Nocardia acididurans TaxID=2802282 RepID=A0ABS1ME24_9NOCA|nr:ADP-ribosylglycohydrolase family protein [Nocardia acididurans]